MADGSSISSAAVCPNFHWSMQGEQFNAELRLLPLGGSDMVLGVQWLKEFGPVTMDLNELSFSVYTTREQSSSCRQKLRMVVG